MILIISFIYDIILAYVMKGHDRMKRRFYEIPVRFLLLIAGIVWMTAGFNVARLGTLSYKENDISWYHPVL